MRPLAKPWKQEENDKVKDSPFFPHCCPLCQEHIAVEGNPFKKNKKFITLSKHLEKANKHKEGAHNRHIEHLKENQQEGSFEEDKILFLQHIRNYNPEIEKSPSEEAKALDSTMDMNSASKLQENNLSSLLESLNNEMFSDLFVSSTVKGKIIMSASLGKISEVKSDMEMSCISQANIASRHNTFEQH